MQYCLPFLFVLKKKEQTFIAQLCHSAFYAVQIPNEEQVTIVLEEDGTIVDCNDFLHILKDFTVLVFLRPGERFKKSKSYKDSLACFERG